jgi:hypothetical protein
VEIRSVIRFSHARHVSADEIHRKLVEVYGKEVTNRQSVAEGFSDVKSGRIGTMDNEGRGRPSKSRSASCGQSFNIRPDLAPSDFYLFPTLKDLLSGHKLASEDDVKTAVTRWSKYQCRES